MITDPADRLQTAFSDAIERTLGAEFAHADPAIRASNKPELGDFQCNAAMSLAKRVGQQPRTLAESLLANVQLDDVAETLEIAGPGFINIRLRSDAIAAAVDAMDTPTLGVTGDEQSRTIVIDLCGVNVAKQMHVGHLRSTIIGDALARVLTRLGHRVHRENHLGDWGLPIAMVLDTLRRSGVDLDQVNLTDLDAAYRRGQAAGRGDEKGLKAAIARHAGPHRIAELEAQQDSASEARMRAGELLVALQDGDEALVHDWHRIIDVTLTAVAEALDLLNIDMGPQHNRGESFYRDRLAGVLEAFQDRNACREDDGALVVDFPDRDRPMLIRKRDGGFLYATTDLAAIQCRTQDTGSSRCIYVVDARQRDHFRDVFDAAAQVGWNRTPDGEQVEFTHTPFGSVLGADRRPLKTRSGENVTLSSLLHEAVGRGRDEVRRRAAEPGSPTHDLPADELDAIGRAVGIGAIKYADLSNDLSRDYVFDLDRMVSFEGDTGPYLQYACARIQSMLRRAGDFDHHAGLIIEDPAERQLSLALLRWKRGRPRHRSFSGAAPDRGLSAGTRRVFQSVLSGLPGAQGRITCNTSQQASFGESHRPGSGRWIVASGHRDAQPHVTRHDTARERKMMSDTTTDTNQRPLSISWWAGSALLCGAIIFSGLLALKRLGLIDQSLPGCGPGSACDKITNGPFGSIPWLDWPVSFVGLAWFIGLLVIWLCGRGGLSLAGRWLIRLGALGSLGFVLVMVAEGAICPYCLATHLCNFGFWLCMEMVGRTVGARTVLNWGISFAVVTLVLAGGKIAVDAQQARIAKDVEEENIQQIIAQTTQPSSQVEGPTDGGSAASQDDTTTPSTDVAAPVVDTRGLLVGRWRLGSEDAPVQVVMFSDYGCPDCRSYEIEMQRVLDQRDDVSLVVKHFPMSTDCNPNLTTNMHANACWAARAAETAGIIGGEEAFWEWHDWLFLNGGKFPTGQLPSLVEEMGFNRQEFTEIMVSDEALIPIESDIADAVDLGLFFTPMIFINGVELKWWAIPSRLGPTVNRVADAIAAGQARGGVAPPLVGLDRYLDDWQGNRRVTIPDRSIDLRRGDGNSDMPVVVLFGDFTSPGTADLWDDIRAWEVDHGDVVFDLRMYPINKQCNPNLPQRIKNRPGACLGARAYFAAGLLEGVSGAMKMGNWIHDQGPALGLEELTEPDLVAAAAEMGFDPANFHDAMNGADVNLLLREDQRAYQDAASTQGADHLHRWS